MTQGVINTKGTQLFFGYKPGASSSDPDGIVIHQVACPTAIPDITAGAKPRQDQTCLSSLTRQYYDGLADPPEMAIPFNFIPRSESHQALIAAKAQGSNLVMPWMIVLSDQTGSPTTIDSEGFLVSPGPTTIGFMGYVTNFTINAAVGEIWKGTVTVQIQLPDDEEDLRWNLPASDLLP